MIGPFSCWVPGRLGDPEGGTWEWGLWGEEGSVAGPEVTNGPLTPCVVEGEAQEPVARLPGQSGSRHIVQVNDGFPLKLHGKGWARG